MTRAAVHQADRCQASSERRGGATEFGFGRQVKRHRVGGGGERNEVDGLAPGFKRSPVSFISAPGGSGEAAAGVGGSLAGLLEREAREPMPRGAAGCGGALVGVLPYRHAVGRVVELCGHEVVRWTGFGERNGRLGPSVLRIRDRSVRLSGQPCLPRLECKILAPWREEGQAHKLD